MDAAGAEADALAGGGALALLAGGGALVFSLFAAVGLALRGVSGDCALVAMAWLAGSVGAGGGCWCRRAGGGCCGGQGCGGSQGRDTRIWLGPRCLGRRWRCRCRCRCRHGSAAGGGQRRFGLIPGCRAAGGLWCRGSGLRCGRVKQALGKQHIGQQGRCHEECVPANHPMQSLARNSLRGQQVAGLRNVGRGGQGAGHALANVGVQDGVGVQPRDDAAHHGKGAHHAPFHRLRPLQQRAAHAKHQQCDALCGRHIDQRGAPQAPEHHPPQCEEAGRPVPARQRAAHGVQPGKHGHVALGVHGPQGRPVQAGDGLVGRRLQGHMGNGWCGDQRGGHAAFWHAASASNAGKSTGGAVQ